MAWTSGTATDQNDLLDQLNTYVTSLGSPWTTLSYVAGASSSLPSTLFLQGPGQGGGRNVFVNIKTWIDGSIPASGFLMHGATSYDSSAGFAAQPNSSPTVYMSLQKASTPYWFFVSNRRIIVVAQIGSVYTSMYAGMFLPNALPSEYPQPLFVGSNAGAQEAANLSDSGNRFFVDPSSQAAFYLPRTSLIWQPVVNNGSGSTNDFNNLSASGGLIWPFRVPPCLSNPATYGTQAWELIFGNLRPNKNGERVLWPASLYNTVLGDFAGTLEGAYVLPGFGLTATQTVTLGARTFIVFPNVFRTTSRNFMAIEEA